MVQTPDTYLLTPEQTAVVAHEKGSALVFAVAGAGKTTAMVHRIERLIREGIFAPQRILATSFGRATVHELKTRLSQWEHCQSVKPKTLHSLGWQILKIQQKNGKLPAHYSFPEGDDNRNSVFYQSLKQARSQKQNFKDIENLSKDDFLDWVGACKGNLEIADLTQLELTDDCPPAAAQLLKQAQSPYGFTDYLPFYQIFEATRQTMGILTFDDLLLEAWLALIRYPSLLEQISQTYDCILVDEFQDLNKVQSEFIDLLAQRHGNLMAIGDDDQTIYEWRGASPDYILNFEQRYQAQRYLLSDNFRCSAGHLLLANAVIEQNVQRAPKRLNLTQGFAGSTSLTLAEDSRAQAILVADQLESLLAAKTPYAEIAILVRSYAQTAFIENELLERGIPYHLPDGRRFYDRPEIRDLISYLVLARLESEFQPGSGLSEADFAVWQQHWKRVRNRPNRYLSHKIAEDIVNKMQKDSLSLVPALELVAIGLEDYQRKALRDLAETLSWLNSCWQTQKGAAETVKELDQRLGWSIWLKSSTPSKELGQERVENIRAFLDYIKQMGDLEHMLSELRRIAQGQLAAENQAEQLAPNQLNRSNSITITSIHRAKGLEWQHVFVPGCNQGNFPIDHDPDIEAERRLLYVALTRPKRALYLSYLKNRPLSPFLKAANAEYLLGRLDKLKDVMEHRPSDWGWKQSLLVCQLVQELSLERYFQHWQRFCDPVLEQLQGFLNWVNQHQLWKKLRCDQALYSIWVNSSQAEAQVLSAGALAQLESLYLNKGVELESNQVQHASFGIGTILREIEGNQTRMLLVRFPQRGKVQLRRDDPELSFATKSPDALVQAVFQP